MEVFCTKKNSFPANQHFCARWVDVHFVIDHKKAVRRVGSSWIVCPDWLSTVRASRIFHGIIVNQ